MGSMLPYITAPWILWVFEHPYFVDYPQMLPKKLGVATASHGTKRYPLAMKHGHREVMGKSMNYGKTLEQPIKINNGHFTICFTFRVFSESPPVHPVPGLSNHGEKQQLWVKRFNETGISSITSSYPPVN